VTGFRVYPVYGVLVAHLVIGQAAVARAQTSSAQAIVSAAREALGGEQRLSAISSFTATGRTRQLRGNNLVPIEFEINCELPDRFVRKDEIPAQDTDATVAGFAADQLILPRTAPIGALLLTGYLGGATATQVRVEDPWFLFPIAVGVLIWGALWLRDPRVVAIVGNKG
jgi:hypothetical protein